MLTLLKGPEIPVPGGLTHSEGRGEMRVKWWLNDEPIHYSDAALQVSLSLPQQPLTAADREMVCGYPPAAPRVFFGHYGYPKPAAPLAPNVACLDLGVVRGGPLCAYRWDGEQEIQPSKFVTVASAS